MLPELECVDMYVTGVVDLSLVTEITVIGTTVIDEAKMIVPRVGASFVAHSLCPPASLGGMVVR